MKKILAIILCLILVNLISCSEKVFVCSDGTTVKDASLCQKADEQKQEIPSQEEKEPEEEPKAEETIAAETKPVQTEVSEKQKQELDKILVNRKTAVYPSSLGVNEQLAIGDSYTFAFGIKNTEIKDTEFKYRIELLTAKSLSFSNIGADETVVSWIKTDAKTYTLKNKETAYIPLIVTVGEGMNKEGKQTLPGVYTFRIITETVKGVFTMDYNTIEFSIRVK